jgi:Secretion system C-terminal sorting domain
MKNRILLFVLSFLAFQVNAQWTQQGGDIDGQANDELFGYSVSLSFDGLTIAVSSFSDGRVRVYKNMNGTWTQIGTTITNIEYIASLSSDGSVVAGFSSQGVAGEVTVKVYKNISNTWIQIGSDISYVSGLFQYGSISLSSDGSIVAIGTDGSSTGNITYSSARVYQNINNTWTQIGAVFRGEMLDDHFGKSISLSSDGSILAIGAPQNSGNGVARGHVRIYKNMSGGWTQIGANINGEADLDRSGWSVSLSSDGTMVAIGAIYNSGGGAARGHVRVYQNVSNTWTQVGADIDGEADSDYSGWSVSLSSDGSIVAIGALANGGHVRVYRKMSGSWTQMGADIDGKTTDDYLGYSVSLSSDGSIVAIGAPYNAGGGIYRGQARIYSYTNFVSNQCTWNGMNITGNWSDATKWSCGHVPSTDDNVIINSGTVTLDAANAATVSIGNMTLNGGTFTSVNNNTLTLTGALNWSGGTISGTGTMTVAMATTITNAPTLDTRKLTLNGGGTIADGFNTSNGAELVIPLSKTLTCTNSTTILWGGNGGVLTLVGTLVKNGVGALECNFQDFHNTGTVNINEGTLRMGYGGTHNGATFNMATYLGVNRFLTIRGGTHTFNGCTFAGTGGFFVTENAIVSTFTNNTVASTLSNFSLGGASTFNLGQSLDLNLFTYFSTNSLTGTFDITANTANISVGALSFTGNLTVNTLNFFSGTLDFTGNLNIGSLNWQGGTIGSTVRTTMRPGSSGTTSNTVTANGFFINNGALTVQSGIFNCNRFANNGGSLTIQSGTFNAGGEFGNFGSLTLQTGSFNANADFYNSNTLTLKSGTFTANMAFINSEPLIIESGIFNANGAFSNDYGTVEVREAGTLHATNTFVVTQGTIKGKGTLNLSADLINTDDAIIAPGLSPGTLTINPSVSSTSAAIYEMEITGNDADKLISTGNIALGGTLKLVLSNPAIGIYTIFNSTSGSVSGYPSPNLSVLYSVNGGAFSATPPPNMSITQPNANNIVVNITGSVLPVELLAFKAQNTEGGNLLTWQTANEINNKGFQIERGFDGKTFETIGFVQAKGVNSAYSFTDKGPLSINYYRLRQMDNDGKETVSKVVTVNLQQKGFSVKAYPNPFRGNLMLDLSTDKKTDVTIELIDILGRHVYQSKAENTEGVVFMPLSTEGLANGTYFLKVSDGQQTIQQKVIKN